MKRRAPLILLVAVVLWPSAGPAQQAPFVQDVFGRINAQRKQHRLPAMTYSKTLEKAAQAHAEWEMGIGVACTPDSNDTFWCVVFGRPLP